MPADDATRRLLIGETTHDAGMDAMWARFVDWLIDGSTPDDRHEVVMGWNWDNDPAVPAWIVRRPDCDKATILLAFWNGSPESFLESGGDREKVETVNLALYDFVVDVRRRFEAGLWGRAEIAFSLEDSCTWRRDFAALDAEFGDRAAIDLPPAMRAPVHGRRLSANDIIEGIPARFWPEHLR